MKEHHFCLDDSPRFKFIELEEVDSTNNFLLHYKPFRPVAMTLVTADHQTAGRGQVGNHWESDPAKNLLFSILVFPASVPASQVFVLSEAIALSIAQTISEQLPATAAPTTIKWPNDIYVGEQKIAGILIENRLSGTQVSQSIIGCGVNINQETFKSDAPNPVSLRQLTATEHEIRFVLEDIIETFSRYYEQIQQGHYADIHAAYLRHLYRRDGIHDFSDETGHFRAQIEAVEPDGHLLLRDTAQTLRRYAFKELKWER